jgi:hypothetical protein
MVYSHQLNILNHGFYGLWDFTAVFADTLFWFLGALSA